MVKTVHVQELFYIAKENNFTVDKFIFTINNLIDVTYDNNNYPTIQTEHIEDVDITDIDIINIYTNINTLTNNILHPSNINTIESIIHGEVMNKILSNKNNRLIALTNYNITMDTITKLNNIIGSTYKEMRESNIFIPWETIREETMIRGSLRVLEDVKIVIYVCKHNKENKNGR